MGVRGTMRLSDTITQLSETANQAFVWVIVSVIDVSL